jgi:muramoyltetrapeptide carboxypeptidase
MRNNINPLKSGDTVLIITPAKAVEKKDVDNAVVLFESWGLKVEIGQFALGKSSYFSGTDKERSSDLQWALDHSYAKAIVCARGGYGTIRIVHEVDYTKFITNPKWIVGFSDVTVLHNKVHRDLLFPSIHAVAPLYFDQLNPFSETLTTLRGALMGDEYSIEVESVSCNRLGIAKGLLIGGNLAILESLIGTNLDIDTTDKILFLEEVSEYAYKLDRMLWSMKYAGKFDNISALVIGGMTDITNSEDTFGCAVEDLILNVLEDSNYPVVFDFPAGHQLDNRAMKFGTNYQLNVGSEYTSLEMI